MSRPNHPAVATPATVARRRLMRRLQGASIHGLLTKIIRLKATPVTMAKRARRAPAVQAARVVGMFELVETLLRVARADGRRPKSSAGQRVQCPALGAPACQQDAA